MPRCSHCGKINREGSLFCQDCGHRLEAAPKPSPPAPVATGGASATCSACGTVNPPGMNFCKMCGTSLAARPAPAANLGHASTVADSGGAAAPSFGGGGSSPNVPAQPYGGVGGGSPAKAICPACGKGTPVGFAFCQHCGQRLAAQPGAAPSSKSPSGPSASPANVASSPSGPSSLPSASSPSNSSSPSSAGAGAGNAGGNFAQPAATPGAAPNFAPTNMGLASTVAPSQPMMPTPPAGLPRNAPQLPSRVATPISGHGGNGNGAGNDAFAQTMAPSPQNMDLLQQARASAAGMAAALPSTTQPDLAPPRIAHGTLVAVNRDGSDGRSVELVGDSFDIGRTEGSLNFADDPYLAPRHLRFVMEGGKVILRPLDIVNGVFLRVQSCELSPGDSFLVGKELLRYEPLAPEERDPPSLVEHGVRLFGSAPREAWGRLRQLTIAGTTRDVWHLTRPELVLGREEGDVTFPDDEFMSRRHAAVKRVGSKARLEDLGSSNGTFVRIKGDRELKAGDLLRAGDQLLRYEP
jgi:pSer/pThr/pTyr-binding forkhead associated (FHA) protein